MAATAWHRAAAAGERRAWSGRRARTIQGCAMTTVLKVSLYAFAGCAALGMLPVAILASRGRRPAAVLLALLIAGYAMFVLIAAAGELPNG
jgi:hypothetical protein